MNGRMAEDYRQFNEISVYHHLASGCLIKAPPALLAIHTLTHHPGFADSARGKQRVLSRVVN